MKWSQYSRPTGLSLLVVLIVIFAADARAADAIELPFITHAAFFSAETHQPKPIDPHVFVRDDSAVAAVGPQNILHAAGIRPPFIDEDAKSSLLSNAEAQPLNFNLGQWLAANGTVRITAKPNGQAEISAQFQMLQPGGHYSLFENHFDQQPVGFTPLDGSGTTNNIVASPTGTAQITVLAPQMPTHANAVLLVFHSDGQFHGTQRGTIGVDAHHQLIARIPQ